MNIARVEIVAHPRKPGVLELQQELEAWLKEKGIEVTADAPDLVVSIGGDGTMLRAAQRAHQSNAPLLGINRGALGYLTEVEPGEEKEAFARIFEEDFTLEERLVLSCHLDGDEYVALNEVLVERSARRRLVQLQVEVGGEQLARFGADGVIVATPTGSTAYALSSGGPIVDPKAHCLVVVPVNAHMVFDRPVVLSASEEVTIRVLEAEESGSLSVDGAMGCDLPSQATVTVRRHPRPIHFVRLSGPGFLERLRAKLRLPD